MSLLQIFLYPFTLIYQGITDFRNHLYQIGSKKSFSFEVFVINVGNLTVGGTGKTPHVEYLIRMLKDQYPLATLSRGYGRKSKGFILADDSANASLIGDEPMQFYHKFSAEVGIAVGEERAFAIPHILFERPKTKVILLDDAFQHRAVTPTCNILLTDYERLFYQDFPFPSGRLRESRYGARRADIVIVSKCPENLSHDQKEGIRDQIYQYTKTNTPIFFTGIRYAPLQPAIFGKIPSDQPITRETSVVLFSGIARHRGLEKYVKEQFREVTHLKFADHHHYQQKDLEKIIRVWQQADYASKIILTTEKDYVKLIPKSALFSQIPLYYLPIEIYFQGEEDLFNSLIINGITDFYSSNK